MEKISRTWSMMSECWHVLLENKRLLFFPLVSGICCLALLASFAIPFFASGRLHTITEDPTLAHQWPYLLGLFAYYAANYFIVIFFNSAMVACAAAQMSGGSPTLGDGLRTATSRLPAIAGWALVSATVGVILRAIEDRSDKVGQIISGLIGMGWTFITFLVVPVLVIENKGPFGAVKESASLVKQTWGEELVSNFSFGAIFSLLSVPAIVLVVLSFHFGHTVGFACLGLGIVYLILLGLVNSALHTIFQTALYLYARNGQVPAGFNEEVLNGAMR